MRATINTVQDLIQSNEEDLKDKTDKKKYKYEMRINENVATGLFKEQFIQLMIETDKRKINAMFDQLADNMMKNIVPVRPDLPGKPRKWNHFNKYKCNQKSGY
ncbi:hypothetical protein FACS189494_01970 [Spirochaetia bacterium]|nr:hypothetical protein FACS189494_01970 [Spirochaetia bacterium]